MNQWVVSKKQMRAFDALTMKRDHISEIELIKRVGKTLTAYALSKKLLISSDQVCLLAGVGNNGSDALVMAAELANRGLEPLVFIVGDLSHQNQPSKELVKHLEKQSVDIYTISNEEELNPLYTALKSSSVVIDGLLGIGVSRPLEGILEKVVDLVNQSDVRVMSIDIPSGIHADNGTVQGISIIAIDTLVVQSLKLGHILNDGWSHCGQKHIIDVGIIGDYSEDEQFLLDPYYYQRFINKRPMFSHKYHYGNILVIGGSKGMMGSSQLSGYAALRSGAGLVRIMYQDQDKSYIPSFYPELMVDTFTHAKEVLRRLDKIDVVVFGMGIPKQDPVYLEILSGLLETNKALIIDATGLSYYKQLMDQYRGRPNVILTPHMGEMAHLLDMDSKALQKDVFERVTHFAKTAHVTLVLKGAVTLIANEHTVFFAQFANPGMATAGSGDVLAGIIGCFMGQKLDDLDAAVTGVSLHSHAGNWAKHAKGEASMIASDIIEGLKEVLKE